MSYIVEYTTLSGKKIAMVHKTYERIEEAIAQATGAVKNGNYKSYKITEGHKVLPAIDRERYPEIPGLEGPFRTLNGGVVYYDPKEGSYYDKDRDMYLSYDEFRQMDTDYSGMKDERDISVKEEDDDRDELTKKLFPRKSREEMEKADKERNRKMNQQRFTKPGKPSRSREWGAYEGVNEARGLQSIDWPDEDMARHAENAIRHGMHAHDAYGHVYSMTYERDWMQAHKDELIKMFASYGLATESVTEAEGEGTYARIIYDYSENWGAIDIYKGHEKVDEWDDYFGANEKGNPLAAKFVKMAKANGLDPMTLPLVDENGDIGKFDGKRFKWEDSVTEAKLSSEQRNRLDDLIGYLRMVTDPEYWPDDDSDDLGPTEILNIIRKEFGDKIADQVESGLDNVWHWGRQHRTSGNDYLSWRKNTRVNKSGKANKTDINALKNTIKRDKGSFAKDPKRLPESELDEVSTEKLRDYASAALQDKNKDKADKRWKYAGKATQTVADREAQAAHDRKHNTVKESLTLDYSRYVRSHGKKPRDTHGGGMWMFTTAEYGWPEDDDMFEFSGSFADAKRAAAKWARSKGVNRFYVMESNKTVTEGLSDDAHHMERDHEVQMARSDLYKTANYAIKLHALLKSISEEEGLEGWMQAKITKAADYISSVYHALEYDMVEKSQSEPIAPAESVEETTSAGGIAAVVQPMGKMIKRKKK